MKNLFKISFAALLLGAFAGCSEAPKADAYVPEFSNEEITATISEETRTLLGAENQVLWSEGDAISFFNKSTMNLKYVLKEGAGETTATFGYAGYTGTHAALTQNYAVYPWSESVVVDEANQKVTGLTLEGDQNYTVGQPVLNGAPMLGVSTTRDFSFKNTIGLIRVNVKAELPSKYELGAISFVSNANLLSGDAEVSLEDNKLTVVTGEKSVEVTLAENAALVPDAAVAAYALVPATAFAAGDLTITLHLTDLWNEEAVEVVKVVPSAFELERSKIFTFNITVKEEDVTGSTEDYVEVQQIDTNEKLEAALHSEDEEISIVLAADNLQVDVTAWDTKAFGGASTKTITIDGAGNTLVFNQLNSDWNNINTHGATLVIKNATLTSTGYNNGPWNRYDLNFACPVVLENVKTTRAIALKGEATLEGVEINETKDAYAIWIQPNGQQVEINDLTVVSAGRGIKIDDQYVDAPALVNLSVANSTFTTVKKAAVLVKSAAGAEITIDNVDIANVAADQVNHVWVDADAVDTNDLVTVNGATKIIEGSTAVEDPADLATLVKSSGVYVLDDDTTYQLPATFAEDVTLIGGENTVLNFANKTVSGLNKVTFMNLTIKEDTGSYNGIQSSNEVNYENCRIEGVLWVYSTNTTFTNCVFANTSNVYNAWLYGGGKATFTNCRFENEHNRSLLVYNEGAMVYDITVEDCTFTANQTSSNKAAIQIHTELGISGKLTINNSTATGYNNQSGRGQLWSEVNNSTNPETPTNVFEVTVDGASADLWIGSAEELVAFANDVNVNKNSYSGKTVALTADIDLQGIDWEPIGQTGVCGFLGVFDGCNHTIYNLSVDSAAETDFWSSGLFGWVESHSVGTCVIKNLTVDGATIKGHHNCGVIAGYLIATIENCHVMNATVSCTYNDEEQSGDKAGAIAGILAEHNAYITNCIAENVQIDAARDAGQIVGAATGGRDSHVTGCSVVNVTVTDNGTGTGANIRNELVGRI